MPSGDPLEEMSHPQPGDNGKTVPIPNADGMTSLSSSHFKDSFMDVDAAPESADGGGKKRKLMSVEREQEPSDEQTGMTTEEASKKMKKLENPFDENSVSSNAIVQDGVNLKVQEAALTAIRRKEPAGGEEVVAARELDPHTSGSESRTKLTSSGNSCPHEKPSSLSLQLSVIEHLLVAKSNIIGDLKNSVSMMNQSEMINAYFEMNKQVKIFTSDIESFFISQILSSNQNTASSAHTQSSKGESSLQQVHSKERNFRDQSQSSASTEDPASPKAIENVHSMKFISCSEPIGKPESVPTPPVTFDQKLVTTGEPSTEQPAVNPLPTSTATSTNILSNTSSIESSAESLSRPLSKADLIDSMDQALSDETEIINTLNSDQPAKRLGIFDQKLPTPREEPTGEPAVNPLPTSTATSTNILSKTASIESSTENVSRPSSNFDLIDSMDQSPIDEMEFMNTFNADEPAGELNMKPSSELSESSHPRSQSVLSDEKGSESLENNERLNRLAPAVQHESIECYKELMQQLTSSLFPTSSATSKNTHSWSRPSSRADLINSLNQGPVDSMESLEGPQNNEIAQEQHVTPSTTSPATPHSTHSRSASIANDHFLDDYSRMDFQDHSVDSNDRNVSVEERETSETSDKTVPAQSVQQPLSSMSSQFQSTSRMPTATPALTTSIRSRSSSIGSIEDNKSRPHSRAVSVDSSNQNVPTRRVNISESSSDEEPEPAQTSKLLTTRPVTPTPSPQTCRSCSPIVYKDDRPKRNKRTVDHFQVNHETQQFQVKGRKFPFDTDFSLKTMQRRNNIQSTSAAVNSSPAYIVVGSGCGNEPGPFVCMLPLACGEARKGAVDGKWESRSDQYPGIPKKKFDTSSQNFHDGDYDVQAMYQTDQPNKAFITYEGWTSGAHVDISDVPDSAKEDFEIKSAFLNKYWDSLDDEEKKKMKKLYFNCQAIENQQNLFWLNEDMSYFHSKVQEEHGLASVWYLCMSHSPPKPPFFAYTAVNIIQKSALDNCRKQPANWTFDRLLGNGLFTPDPDTVCEKPQNCKCKARFNFLHGSRRVEGQKIIYVEARRDGTIDLNRFKKRDLCVFMTCSDACGCSPSCPRRILQRGQQTLLVVVPAKNKGFGLSAGQRIVDGQLVCDYVGEVALKENDSNKLKSNGRPRNSTYEMDFKVLNEELVVDSEYAGNVSRFINHSCNPNTRFLEVDSRNTEADVLIPQVAVIAIAPIEIAEDITAAYWDTKLMGNKKNNAGTCKCGESNCGRYLPSG